MALIKSIKHCNSKLARYIKQAKRLLHGSPDGDRKPEVNVKANEPREIAKAPMITISEPVAATAITGAHVGDTEVVLNEGCDQKYWAWNELPPMRSERQTSPKPSTASAPELKGQEPTVDNGDNVLLKMASIGNSITRILQSASDSLTTPPSASVSAFAHIPTPTTSPTTVNSSPSSYFPVTSSYSSLAPPRRFQRSPFFGKKIGVTPRVSRIRSVSGTLDPGTPVFQSPTGPTLVAGSEKESEWHSEDEGSTLIEPEEGSLETFGAENGGRPFVAILANLRQVLGPRSSPAVPNVRPVRAIASPPLPIEEGYQRAFATVRELRSCLERT